MTEQLKNLSQKDMDTLYSVVFASVQESAKSSKVDILEWSFKHHQFFEAGKSFVERGFTAGNRCAKTSCAAAEYAFHLRGIYPAPGKSFPRGWQGRRFKEPVELALLSNTTKQLRTAAQRILFGRKKEGKWQGGMIPTESIIRVEQTKGVSDAIDFCEVKHEPTGGSSVIYLKSAEMDWESIQGMELHGFWMDEEPPISRAMNIYHEIVPRLVTTNGIFMLTATPQRQMTELMALFFGIDFTGEGVEDEAAKYRTLITMGIEEANHLTKEQRERFTALIPQHLRESRLRGIPSAGMGLIYDIPEIQLGIEPFDVMEGNKDPMGMTPWDRQNNTNLRFIIGMDLGFSNSYSAFVWMAYDTVSKVIYLFDCMMVRQQTPAQISASLKRWDRMLGMRIPVAWPKDVGDQGRTTGEVARDLYIAEDVNMIPICAAVESRENRSVHKDDKIIYVWNKIGSGQLKVFNSGNMLPWWNQWKMYRVDEKGKIVKTMKHQFDLMDAFENGVIMCERWSESPGQYQIQNLQSIADSSTVFQDEDNLDYYQRGKYQIQPYS